MILTCPSCSAKFMISSEALGADGREVRCGKCSHMWFQPGERDSLDELPPIEPQEDIDIGFVNHVDEPESIPEVLKPRASTEAISKEKKPFISFRKVIGVAAAAIIILTLVLIFISLRDTLGRQFPFLGGAYEKMGLHLTKEQASVAIDRLKTTQAGAKLNGTMYLINLTSNNAPVKKITAELLDLDDKILKTIDVKVPETIIKGENQSKIDFVFDTVPKGAVATRIKVLQD